MAIINLIPTNFRNLQTTEIKFHEHLNFISGLNASGKTSLLEAIYFLSTGKSFRSRKIRNIVNRNTDAKNFILFGSLSDELESQHQVGIRKSITSNTDLKLNGELIRSASKLAFISPVVVIDPSSFELLIGSAKIRRRFLDWGVFHVEHGFSKVSNEYNICLKQRNTLLRTVSIDTLQLNIWDRKLAGLGEMIDEFRSTYSKAVLPILKTIASSFMIEDGLEIRYQRGWDKELTMREVLAKHQRKDIEKKFTQFGAHRADLRLTIRGRSVEDILSRGQQKLLIIALYLAQIQCLADKVNKRTVVLIDDISAELDSQNLQLIFDKLSKLKTQVICTALDSGSVHKALPDHETYKMFHVEHGNILTIK